MHSKTFPKIPLREVISETSRDVFLIRENEATVIWSQDSSQLSLLAQLKPAWLAMKAFGLLPIFSARPAAVFRAKGLVLNLLQAAYGVGFYLIFVALVLKKLIYLRSKVSSNGPLSTPRLIFALMATSFLVPHLLIAPLHWIRISRVLRYFKDWETFQARFLMVTRHHLHLDLQRRATVMIVLVVVGSSATAYSVAFSMLEKTDYTGKLFYMYAITQINVLLAVWVLLCQASAEAAKQLAKRLKEEFLKVGVVGEHVVPSYHRVWLRLSQLTRDIGAMFSSVFRVIVLFWLALMLLSAFQSATLLANSCPAGTLIRVIILALFAMGSVQTFCHSASLATEAVQEHFLKSLVGIQGHKRDIQKQLQDLELAVNVHDSTINLGGYFNVNRSLMVSIVSAFATFLVVLFQSTSASDNVGCSFTTRHTQNGTQ